MTPDGPPPEPVVDDPDRRHGRSVRVLDAVAGLLAAGILVVGVLLLLAQLIVPSVLASAGLGHATGPGWGPVAAHLVVGAVGESAVRGRGRLGTTARVAVDLAVVVAALGTVAFAWWP